MGDHVRVGELNIWTEQVGEGSDVLLIGGLGDTVESWQFQLDGLADRYRLIAFDNRGAGRTAMPKGPASVEAMADDAAGVRGRSRSPPPTSPASRRQHHLAGARPTAPRARAQPRPAEHLGGTGPLFSVVGALRPRAGRGRAERAGVPRVVFPLDFYTPRAHNDGTVDQIVEEVLAFPHKQSTEDVQAFPRRVPGSRHD